MGRRRNNPDLVQELIDRRWDDSLGEDEYQQKYASLSSSDMSKVAVAIDGMESEFLSDDADDGTTYCCGVLYDDGEDSCRSCGDPLS